MAAAVGFLCMSDQALSLLNLEKKHDGFCPCSMTHEVTILVAQKEGTSRIFPLLGREPKARVVRRETGAPTPTKSNQDK